MANYLATDTDLTAVANAIRTKGGTSAQLEFPAGFVDAIGDIQGDGYTIDDFLTQTGISGDITITIQGTPFTTLENRTEITSATIANDSAVGNMFRGCTKLESVVGENITRLYGKNSVFENCTALETVRLPKATDIGQAVFKSCTSLAVIALPSVQIMYNDVFYGCSSLAAVDLGVNANINRTGIFYGCTSLAVLILRKANGITPLGATGAFGDSPFDSSGAGGTIYIPKALYDHLGDGTASDYKAATNWSTIDGYGTITWAQIEGSQYENYYADGTPIT
jgi:hypothetical protein